MNETIIELKQFLDDFTILSKNAKQIIINYAELSYLRGRTNGIEKVMEINHEN